MIYLAVNDEKLILVHQIAEDYKIPKYYLAKIVQTLSKHNLIKSTRGRNGGIQLSKPAGEIKILDIIHAINGPPGDSEMCIFGLDICSDLVPCPVHEVWKSMKADINDKLIHQNLESLAKEVHRKHELLNKI
ncbi:MAG: Rrf2 family transcriptional regulator [Candidatus Marinimicrobia bacterium]|nr:Rrf2 family transcriptional regulator [Candidatus Neomarinimicrobiota bacterium]